jgi:hypothetical protein
MHGTPGNPGAADPPEEPVGFPAEVDRLGAALRQVSAAEEAVPRDDEPR